jgi:glycerol-3-phosphate acyltransferase PlsY
MPVSLAPLLGHNYSPFLKGRGGKGVAVTGGIWIGLTSGIGGAIGTAFLTLGALVQGNSGWAVVMGLVSILVYLLIWNRDPVLLAVWVGNALLVLWSHRKDLSSPPILRDWIRRRADHQGET